MILLEYARMEYENVMHEKTNQEIVLRLDKIEIICVFKGIEKIKKMFLGVNFVIAKCFSYDLMKLLK